MKDQELHQLSQSDNDLLALLFDAVEQDESIDRLRFRATHCDHIACFDQLESTEYLRQDEGRYRISLMGLRQMTGAGPRQILSDTEVLWRELRKHYKSELTVLISLRDLAERGGLELAAARRTLIYMLEAPWSAGRTTSKDMLEVEVAVSESVMRFDTFEGQIRQMRGWQTDRIWQRSNPAPNRSITAETERAQSLDFAASPWLGKLPQDAQILMNEIYAAVKAGTFALPAMGIRAVVDVISREVQQADIGSFRKKLDGLRDSGHLTPAQHDSLEAVVDAGNAAAHRGFAPSAEALGSMLIAVEHLLHVIYVMPESTRLLRAGTPKREPS